MVDWIIRVIGSAGYAGMFLLIALENVFPPIPSEVILVFGGFMTTRTTLQPFFVILCATAGSLLGAIILYFSGRLLGLERILKLSDRFGKYIGLKREQIEKADAWHKKHENKTVFFCRMVPVLRSLISVPAGVSEMNFTSFILLTAAGSLIWNTALVAAGALLGENWENAVKFLDTYKIIIAVIAGILTAGFISFKAVKAVKRRKKKKTAA